VDKPDVSHVIVTVMLLCEIDLLDSMWCSFVMILFVVIFWITRWLVVQSTYHLTIWLEMCLFLTCVLSLMPRWKQLGMSLFSRKLPTTWKYLRYCIAVAD